MSLKKGRYRHNKKRNTAFLFEALVKEMAKCVLSKDASRQAQAAQLIKKHFAKGTALYEELQLYRAINETKEVSTDVARRIIIEARHQSEKLDRKKVFKEQSGLIRKVNHSLGSEVYTNFVPSYKNLASIAQLFADTTPVKKMVLLEDTLVEGMTIKKPEVAKRDMDHVDSLVYKTFAKRFNEQYSDKLQNEQREVLTRYVFSMSDNGVSLKSYLNEEVERLRTALEASYTLDEIKKDDRMLENAKKVVGFLDSLQTTPLTEKEIEKILKVQELVKEVHSNG
jgi:hypothetical protein